MAVNTEAPNTLLSNTTMRVVDLLCEGPISGFTYVTSNFTGDPLQSVYYNDTAIRNADGSYNYNISGAGFQFAYALGSAAQTGIPGFQKIESLIPLGANTLVSNPLPGAGPYKTVVAGFNTQMYPDVDSIRVTMRVPALFSQDDNGNTNGFNVGYAIDVSLNDGTFNQMVFDEFNGKCTVPYLRDHIIVLPKTSPASTYQAWKVRVRRTTTDIQSIRTQNAIYVHSMSLISSSLYAYPNSALVATEISANQFSEIPARAYDIYGMLLSVPNGYTPTQYNSTGVTFTRQCDITISNKLIGLTTQSLDQMAGIEVGSPVAGAGIPASSKVTSVHNQGPDYFFAIDQDPTASTANTAVSFTPINTVSPASYPTVWTGDFKTGVWTDNPAWIFYDMLTNPVHGLGDYISSSAVDKWTLYQLAQYCDQLVDDGQGGLEPRFTCNVSIQQPEQAYSALLNLASTFRGMLYYANGTIHPISTNDLQSPVYAFNNSNVVNGTFSYSDTANSTRSTVAVVKYTDPLNGWRDNVAYVEDIDGILRYGYNEKQMSAFACTTQGQAYRLGSWTLETERLLTETVTFQTSMEGLYLMPGDVFAVYDNFRNNRIQAGRVQVPSTGGSQIVLDRPVALEAGITYSLTCVTPQFVLDGTGSITGSDQIPLIRNPQIQSFRVTDGATTSIQKLTVAGQFASGIYVGSPWILSASGNTGIFNKASFYTCLATSEIEPGKIEVLGLQASTGITFNISTGYTVIDQPPNNGNSATILPPSNLVATWVTGALASNTFYSNLVVNWTDSPSSNLAYYVFSGQTPGSGYTGATVVGPSDSYEVTLPGSYSFKVAAVSEGGVYSTFVTTNYVIPNSNPFGVTPPLSGVFISQNADDLYANPVTHALTGYVGTQPEVSWNFQQDTGRGIETPAFDLITGYRLRASGFDGTTNYLTTPIVLEGNGNSVFQFPDRFLYTGLGGVARRGFDLWVDTLDQYGGVATGAHIKINNEPPGPPTNSGFVGFNGGISYNVTPAINSDISGIYMWWNFSAGFTPTFPNANYVSDNMAGLVFNNTYQTGGNYFLWYALTDTFGYTGCPIYGPIPVDSNGSITGAYLNINQSIQSVKALTTGSSGVLSAQVTSVQTALASTGTALAQWITFLGAKTSGVTASVTILTSAMISGATNGTGGLPIATWGFLLDANGKVVSMKATTTSYGNTDYGTIAFSGASLQSESFTMGSKGWRITPTGDAEFNNIVARGTFTGGVGTSVTWIDVGGLGIGDPNGVRTFIGAGNAVINGYINAANSPAFSLSAISTASITGGLLRLYTLASNGVPSSTFQIDGSNGGTMSVPGLATFNGGGTFNGTALFNSQASISSTNKLLFTQDGGNSSYLYEENGVNLHGDATHPVAVRNCALVRGAAGGGSYTAGDIYGFGLQMDPGGTAPNDFLTASTAGADHAFANYLTFKANGATVYVPYLTSAP